MNQLTTIERSAVAELPVSLQEFVRLRQESPIKSLSQSSVKKACAEMLTKASFDMGSPMADDPQILKFQTEALYGELSGKFRDLTLSEVFEAFKRGIRGEFGPYFGMCPKTYHQFIKTYFELPARGQAQIEYLKKIAEVQTSDVPVQVKEMFSHRASVELFREYKAGKPLPIVSAAFYNVINAAIGLDFDHPKEGKIKTLVADKEIRSVLYKETKKEYETTIKKSISAAKFKQEKQKVEDFELLLMNLTKSRSFENLLKKNYLKHFFDSLIREGKELEL